MLLFENDFVVGIRDLPHVVHADVAYFDMVAVEDFVKCVMFQEMSVHDLKKYLCYVGCYVLTVEWIEPRRNRKLETKTRIIENATETFSGSSNLPYGLHPFTRLVF